MSMKIILYLILQHAFYFQVEFYIDLNMPERAAEIAKSAKNIDLLDNVLNAIGSQNTVLTETINSFKSGL